MRILTGILFLVGWGAALHGQQLHILENDLTWRLEEGMASQKNDLHSSIKPYFTADLKRAGLLDSMPEPFFGLPALMDTGRKLSAHLLLDVMAGADVADTSGMFKGRTGAGFMLESKPAEKWYLNGAYIFNRQVVPDYLADLAEERYMLPSDGFVKPGRNPYITHSLSGYASFTPNKHFNFQLGQGRNFFGDGYRSMLLSDNQYAYPYLKVTSTFWRFRYVNLYSMQRNIAESGGDRSGFETKFTTMHYLSYNVNDVLNLNFFEAVVWHARDNNLMRGYDMTYLNPIILYRPAEFNAGSADNALLGAGFKWKITDKLNTYGQLLLDEFLFAHIKEDWQQFLKPDEDLKSGWWANKWAFQIGLKAFDLFGNEGLSFQTEFNTVRPYTYSHGTVTQSYTHNGQPLAHPLGANFYEWINSVRYQKGRMLYEAKFIHAIHGDNPSVLDNYGGDIFIPYRNRSREFENFTGQGIQKRILFGQIRASALLIPASNLRAEAGIDIRNRQDDFSVHNTVFFHFGLRSALYNRNVDY